MPDKANDSRDKVRLLQRALYRAAKRSPRRRFHALYDKVYRWDVLERAWREVRANRGQGGVDGETIERVERGVGVGVLLGRLRDELRAGRYRPRPVRRVEVPKASGGLRPLGIPAIWDRVVQAACRIVLEPIFEADFLDCSRGFRPKRSAHGAHSEVKRAINCGCNWVVDADIEKYFDSIDHRKLMVLLRRRISDRRVLRLIRGWLKAGVMKEGVFEPTCEGTPQGGVISPLLSNVYLHFLDVQWQGKCGGLGKLVRYADDFLILCRNRSAGQRSLEAAGAILGRLRLRLHPQKTRFVEMYRGKQGFDFLGFHFRRCASWRYAGRYYCLNWPSAAAMKRIRQKVKAVTAHRWRLRFTVESIVKVLNPILRGWVNYFRVANSSMKFSALDDYVCLQLALFWRKKHQLRRRWLTSSEYARLEVFRATGRVAWA